MKFDMFKRKIDDAPSSSEKDRDATAGRLKESELQPDDLPDDQYPGLAVVIPVMFSLAMAMFLVSLDRSIIGTAIPRITDEFNSLNDVGWYGSAYLFTNCAFQLLYGRFYTFWSVKTVFLLAVLLFEVGSAICGAAPNSTTLIIGRAIAGLGGAGVFPGVMIIIISVVPLRKRPMYQGIMGAMLGISGVAGPLVGGAFTTHVSWRWCFYINLPVGGFVLVACLLLLKTPPPVKAGLSWRQQIKELDILGTLAFIPAIICLLLALQWGGLTYSWGNGRIIALLVLFAVLLGIFMAIQIWKPNSATLPLRILGQRSVASGFWYNFTSTGSQIVLDYFLPIWFQSIKGVSAAKSGIDNLPVIIAVIPGAMVGGIVVSKLYYYTPVMIASAVIRIVGAALLCTFKPDTGHAMWIGYQVVFGFGLGLGMMHANMAAQVTLPKVDVATGISLMFFGMSLGPSIFVSVAQNVFAQKLVQNLHSVAAIDTAAILNAGATNLRSVVAPSQLATVLVAYNGAIIATFYVMLALAAASLIPSLTMEWRSVKGRKRGQEGCEVESAEETKAVPQVLE